MAVAQPGPGASGCATRRGGGHLSFVVAGNAAGLTATAAGPGSFYGPHQLRLLSLYLSLHSVDYSTDHSSPSETSYTVCEDPIPPKLDKKKSCCLARGKSAGQSANELAPAFLERQFFFPVPPSALNLPSVPRASLVFLVWVLLTPPPRQLVTWT